MSMDEMARVAQAISDGRTSLGIELGSTRIKAVLIDDTCTTIAQSSHSWESHVDHGLWTYGLDEVWSGIQDAFAQLAQSVRQSYGVELTTIGQMGFSAMMHGYLAFDSEGNVLVPFRTWQNTNTHRAHEELSKALDFNIPERWSIAHLYQAALDQEEHVPSVSFITTLAGYVHWKLTGEKVLGIGDASGMFPVDPPTHNYDETMLSVCEALPVIASQPWNLREILPAIRVAGQSAGTVSAEGALLLDPTGTLQAGSVVAPPEGDAGTGMVATNSVRVRTGNVSAGTSIFAMVVLEKKLSHPHPEIDIVTTPAGDLVGMSHANNFTKDLNAWVGLFRQFAHATGMELTDAQLFAALFNAALADDTDAHAGGLLNYCFYSGEFLMGLEQGRPVFARGPQSTMSLGNFMRAQLFSAFAPVTVGMHVLTHDEGVQIDSLVGHGGIFATPVVAQRILAAAFNAPIRVMDTAAEGGAWGMAVLARYMRSAEMSLDEFLQTQVFSHSTYTVEYPQEEDVHGFNDFFARFNQSVEIEKAAIRSIDINDK